MSSTTGSNQMESAREKFKRFCKSNSAFRFISSQRRKTQKQYGGGMSNDSDDRQKSESSGDTVSSSNDNGAASSTCSNSPSVAVVAAQQHSVAHMKNGAPVVDIVNCCNNGGLTFDERLVSLSPSSPAAKCRAVGCSTADNSCSTVVDASLSSPLVCNDNSLKRFERLGAGGGQDCGSDELQNGRHLSSNIGDANAHLLIDTSPGCSCEETEESSSVFTSNLCSVNNSKSIGGPANDVSSVTAPSAIAVVQPSCFVSLTRRVSDSSLGSADSMQDLTSFPNTRGNSSTSLQGLLFKHGQRSPCLQNQQATMTTNTSTTSVCSRDSLPGVGLRGSVTFQAGQFYRGSADGGVPVAGRLSITKPPRCANYQSASSTLEEVDRPYYMKQSSEYSMAKHLFTEHVMTKHTLKGKMSKFQRLLDRAFTLIAVDTEDAIIEGAGVVAKVMVNAWIVPKIGHDLAYGLCDYMREMGYFDSLTQFYLSKEAKERIRVAAGRALEECLSSPNRDYLVTKGHLEDMVTIAKSFKEGEELRISVSLFESLFKQSAHTNAKLIEMGALDYVLNACKATAMSQTFRHAALALANLAMYCDNECQQKMIAKNVPDWLFLLASSQDDVTRYYACLAICALVSNKEIEAAVIKSGTLSLVEPFLLAHKPADFAHSDYKHHQGRPREWLERLVPMLTAKRREPRSMAAFHFAMEAGIKKEQDKLEIFEEINAVDALKLVASYPDEVAPKFASQALEIIGAEVPYKLSQQVPLWSVDDVQYWVTQIGFEKYASKFHDQKVDGDLLLLLTNEELERDIGMVSGLLRKRFMRELDSLKIAADYTGIDETHLDRFLVSVSPQFSIYAYQLLEKGADRSILPSLSEENFKNDLGITNPIHRMKILQALEECKHTDDMEIAILSRQIDIFISYRRSTGNQLASLIKVLLQLRGYKVFIDVDRLYAGKFDSSLLKNIQAAKHFVLVLTPQALLRCLNDDDCSDWVHKEVLCALEHNKNVIPIFDPQFEWPDDQLLPADMRAITRFNGVRWVHEYQEACVDKLEKFIKGELNIDRGFYPLPERGKRMVNFRSTSKQASTHSGQMTPTQFGLESQNVSNYRSLASSRDDLSTISSVLQTIADDSAALQSSDS